MARTLVGRDYLAVIVSCAALNLAIGAIVSVLKLPFYLDSIGTVLAAYLGGPWVGIATGILGTLVGSLYIPTLWAYSLTAVAIAVYTVVMIRFGFLKKLLPTILAGLGLGIVTAIFSAPVTAFVFGGISLAGADAVTALIAATGKNIAQSVVLGGLATDPLDKLFTSLIAFAVIRRLPTAWRRES